MTVAEAIDELKLEWNVFMEGIDLTQAENNPEFKQVRDANMMAIRSLEAWDKVTEEICKLHDNDEAYWNGVYDCLKIINRHLQGVKENENRTGKA